MFSGEETGKGRRDWKRKRKGKEEKILGLAASFEASAEHPIAAGIIKAQRKGDWRSYQ